MSFIRLGISITLVFILTFSLCEGTSTNNTNTVSGSGKEKESPFDDPFFDESKKWRSDAKADFDSNVKIMVGVFIAIFILALVIPAICMCAGVGCFANAANRRGFARGRPGYAGGMAMGYQQPMMMGQPMAMGQPMMMAQPSQPVIVQQPVQSIHSGHLQAPKSQTSVPTGTGWGSGIAQ